MVSLAKHPGRVAFALYAGGCALVLWSCADNEIRAIEKVSAAGGASGTGNDASAGQAGSGGVSGAGGKDAGGGKAGSGAAGSSGQGGVAGSSGTGGTPDSGIDGDSGVLDCAAQCGADYCQGLPQGTGCSDCLINQCLQAEARLTSALDAPDYQACMAGCTDATCETGCCNQYPQGCSAVRLEHLCACGYPPKDCKPLCPDACMNAMSASCEACARDTPCSIALYDYDFTQDLVGHACMDGCGGDPTCQLVCCGTNPIACAAYKVATDCVCGL